MNRFARLCACSYLLLILLTSCRPDRLPEIHLSFTPQAVLVDGKQTIYYELDVVNILEDSIEITHLEIHRDELALLSVTGPALKQRATAVSLGPHDTATVYIELVAEGESGIRHLSHQFRAEVFTRSGPTSIMFDFDAEVSKFQPVVIGAPLGEGMWAAVYDPAWNRGHRRVRFPGSEKKFLPGRFAIDFIQLDSSGHYAQGDENQTANWFGYGQDVLAVADGIVVAARDDFDESPTLDAHPRYPAERATGNYVAIEIAASAFVFYEHLKPGSIRVSKGQRVRRGDVIAQLGFTGQSTGPHLHMHVSNDNAPLLSEGIAFVFDKFELIGRYDDFSAFGKERWDDEPVSIRSGERPPVNSVVRFGK